MRGLNVVAVHMFAFKLEEKKMRMNISVDSEVDSKVFLNFYSSRIYPIKFCHNTGIKVR